MTVHEKKSLVPAGGPLSGSIFAPLQREIDRVFTEFGDFDLAGALGPTPRMDLRETDQGIELSVELPGVDQKDLKVEFADDVLTLSGEKKSEADKKEGGYRFIERRYGAFSRSLRLPGVDGEQIKATLKDGVLTIAAPRKPGDGAGKIHVPIKTA